MRRRIADWLIAIAILAAWAILTHLSYNYEVCMSTKDLAAKYHLSTAIVESIIKDAKAQNFTVNGQGGWVLCSERLPRRGRYVLVARPPGYAGVPIEYLTAQCNTEYKGWTDPSNTRLTDSGRDPVYWFDGDLPGLPAPI